MQRGFPPTPGRQTCEEAACCSESPTRNAPFSTTIRAHSYSARITAGEELVLSGECRVGHPQVTLRPFTPDLHGQDGL